MFKFLNEKIMSFFLLQFECSKSGLSSVVIEFSHNSDCTEAFRFLMDNCFK